MLDSLLEKMAEVFSVDKNELNVYSDIKNTDNWTSLNHVQLILELCKYYDFEFDSKLVIELTSVKKILNFLEKRSD